MSEEGKKRTDLMKAKPRDLEFRKPNESIGLRVKEGKLSLLSRKLYNVAVFHAQQLREPGKNAPIDTPAAKKYFWFPASDAARNANYDSKDMALLLRHFDELQNVKVHMEDARQYTSERLISSVKVVNPNGLKKKGGMLWIGVAFPPEVHEQIMAPNSYTKLSIYFQGVLGSASAIALYEICRRYATNPSKVTFSQTFEYWYEVLSGVSIKDEPPPQYKYYKRDTIKPSMLLINELTDIEIELIEEKRGKKVIGLQFRVALKSQSGLEFPPPPILNGALISELMEFGFGESEAEDMSVLHSEETLRSAMRATVDRKTATHLKPLESEVAYFRWALKNPQPAKVAALPKPKPQAAVKPSIPEPRPLLERFLSARARDAHDEFMKLEEAQQAELLVQFKGSSYSKGVRITKLDTPTVRSALGMWYAQEVWGEPTAEALAKFVELTVAE